MIAAFNGQRVEADSQLFKLLADAKIGSTATIEVLREHKTLELHVPIVARSNASRTR